MDDKLRKLERLASQGDVLARTELAFLNLRNIDNPVASFAFRLAEGMVASTDSILWLGGNYRGYETFISISMSQTIDSFLRASFYMSGRYKPVVYGRATGHVEVCGSHETAILFRETYILGMGYGHPFNYSEKAPKLYPDPNEQQKRNCPSYNTWRTKVQEDWYKDPKKLLFRMMKCLEFSDKQFARFDKERQKDGLYDRIGSWD